MPVLCGNRWSRRIIEWRNGASGIKELADAGSKAALGLTRSTILAIRALLRHSGRPAPLDRAGGFHLFVATIQFTAQGRHRRSPGRHHKSREQETHSPAISSKRKGSHDHRPAFDCSEGRSRLRQGDEDGRQRNRGSSAKQTSKAFRPHGVAEGREYGNCNSACNEP